MSTVEAPAAPVSTEVAWSRLDWRMLLVRPAVDVIRSLPLLVGALLFDRAGGFWQWIALAATGFTVVVSVAHILTARYRVTEEQMELRTGILHRRHRAVPLDRVRTVDSTAELKHRLFGLTALKVGTGRHTKDRSDELVLDAVSRAEAQRLTTVLLHRRPEVAEPGDGAPVDSGAGAISVQPKESVLAVFDRRWIRFSPFALSGLATVGAIVGFVYHYAHELHVDPSRFGPLRSLAEYFTAGPSALAIVVAAVGLMVLVSLASVAGYVLSFWNFRLTRGNSALHVRRGLITTRSVSIEEDRLRGILLRQPLPVRLLGGARCVAVASGLTARTGGSVLLPFAPAERAHEVAASVLREESDPGTVPLVRHPRRALNRRLNRAIGGVLLLAVLLFLGAWIGFLPAWLWKVALVFVPIAAVVGWDRYRNLGHALTERYVLSRKGSLERETLTLKRDAIIGWKMDRSFFQHRAGLMTLVATVAAGHGSYPITDMAESDALKLADAAIPGLLSPFLEDVP
jgi:putative membrane protein